jgi:uncharacterized protein
MHRPLFPHTLPQVFRRGLGFMPRRAVRWLAGLAAVWLACCQCMAAQPAAEAPVHSCPPPPRAPTAEDARDLMRRARDHGFLWSITKDGRTSYLYGTLHVGRAEWLFPGPAVMHALEASTALALEIDASDPANQQALAAGAAAVPGRTLPPALQRRVAAAWQAACLDAGALQSMAPEFLAMTLGLVPGMYEGLSPAYGIDAVLEATAKSLGKQVLSLESVESQLPLLRAKDAQEMVETVTTAMDDLERGATRRQLLRVASTWERGDYVDLANYARWCECLRTHSQREAMKALLDDRNTAMAERIDGLHTGGQRVFAAVGSLHMAGPAALPTLMARRGYAVRRIVFTDRGAGSAAASASAS